MLATILALVQKLLGILFPDKAAPTPEAVAEKTGEDAGKAKAEDAAAQATVKNAEIAQEVRNKINAEKGTPALTEDDGFRTD